MRLVSLGADEEVVFGGISSTVAAPPADKIKKKSKSTKSLRKIAENEADDDDEIILLQQSNAISNQKAVDAESARFSLERRFNLLELAQAEAQEQRAILEKELSKTQMSTRDLMEAAKKEAEESMRNELGEAIRTELNEAHMAEIENAKKLAIEEATSAAAHLQMELEKNREQVAELQKNAEIEKAKLLESLQGEWQEDAKKQLKQVSERSERALRKNRAMDLAKLLFMTISTTELTYSAIFARSLLSTFV